LGGDDAAAAHRKVWELVGSPEGALAVLGERLKPVPPLARRLDQLIADLDSRRFPVRQKATAELAQLGSLATPALTRALEKQPSLERRRRIELLLAKVREAGFAPEQLRALRAVEVLEHIGTEAARAILQRLTDGEPEALLTLEARASLERLARRAR